jgi:hypothetical protein
VAFEASRVCGPSGSSVSSCSVRTPRSAAQTDSADSLVGISATGLREHRTPRYRIALGSCHPGTPASCSVAVVICTGARASSNPTVPLGVDARSLRIAWAADAELKAETGQSLSSARKEALKFAELYLESMTYSHLLHRRAFSFLVVSRSRSHTKSFIFNVSPAKHASCRASPKLGLKSRSTHPYPNFPKRGRRNPPSFSPVLRQCAASNWRGNGVRAWQTPALAL